jgi:hypothetical protein
VQLNVLHKNHRLLTYLCANGELQPYEWELQYGMNNYGRTFAPKGRELFIANYELDAPRAPRRARQRRAPPRLKAPQSCARASLPRRRVFVVNLPA